MLVSTIWNILFSPCTNVQEHNVHLAWKANASKNILMHAYYSSLRKCHNFIVFDVWEVQCNYRVTFRDTVWNFILSEFSIHPNGFTYLRATGREFSFQIKMTSQPLSWRYRARNKYDIDMILIKIALFRSVQAPYTFLF